MPDDDNAKMPDIPDSTLTRGQARDLLEENAARHSTTTTEVASKRTLMWDDYSGIDPGVRFAVRVLHAHGIETGQSCQGGEGHSYDEATVEMRAGCSDSGGFAALAVLRAFGLPVNAVALRWPVHDGLPYEKNWRITFSRTMEDRADDDIMFIWGY